MPTYAGYLMTPQHQLAWLRREPPKIGSNEYYLTLMQRLHARLRKFGLNEFFALIPVLVPQEPESVSGDDLGYIFARRIRRTGGPVSLPPREIPGLARDIEAGRILKKYFHDITDWVVIHQPVDDSISSSYIPWDKSSKP